MVSQKSIPKIRVCLQITARAIDKHVKMITDPVLKKSQAYFQLRKH